MGLDINIAIDLTDLLDMHKLTKGQQNDFIEEILDNVSQAVIYNWREEAHNGLNSTRNQYLRAIQQPDIKGTQAIIELIGTLPNMIENGASAFDEKSGFALSDKKHMKKNGGWYINIPFRWATPDAIGEDEAFSAKMPQAVYNVAKSLDPATSNVGKKIVYGGALDSSDLPSKFQGLQTRAAISDNQGNVLYGAYQHKTNIFQGMIREEKAYEKATQGQYVTFRRISDLSDPMSWIHPGFVAKNFADKAINIDIDTIVDNTVENLINNII